MRRWAGEDGWEIGRERMRDQWRQQAKQQLVRGLLRRHERQMQVLGHLHDEAVRLRHQPSVQPRSWESVANVQLKAAQMMREWAKDTHEAVASLVGTHTQRQPGETTALGAGLDMGAVGSMDDEEARLGAHAILRDRMKRRLRRPEQMGEDDQEAPPVAPPVPLRAANGDR